MKYISTRGKAPAVSAAQAIINGIAPDGGLYVPDKLPKLTSAELGALRTLSYAETAVCVLHKFIPEIGTDELSRCVAEAYESFDTETPAPVTQLSDGLGVMELWHGPTCAFKDMALQLFPRLLPICKRIAGFEHETDILVATSGDTGKAALEGFKDVPGTRICVLYPAHGVSTMQRLQMATQTGGNVSVLAIEGNFDDAQSAVKRLFADEAFNSQLNSRGKFLSSANSINVGRLLPQIVYYVYASAHSAFDEPLNFVVPCGNFGNILAGLYAKKLGCNIGKLVCASNSNRVLTDFFESGTYNADREFFRTISPSMDILVSSNLERLLHMISGGDAALVDSWMRALNSSREYSIGSALRRALDADFMYGCADEAATLAAVRDCWDKYHYLIDTHTAVAFDVYARLKAKLSGPTVIVSTASPYKFAADVLKALGRRSESDLMALRELSAFTGTAVPPQLAALESAQVRFEKIVGLNDVSSAVMDSLYT